MRIIVLAIGLSALASACSAGTYGETGSEEPPGATDEELTSKPTVWMPFQSGAKHKCTQGNGGLTSHSFATTQYALDFDTPNSGPAESVVAALAGKVKYIKTGCVVGDKSCGGGFGNHVRLAHGGSYFTIYGHLSSVTVLPGDLIGRGQLVGYEGTTGNSSGDHVHFSLHKGDPTVASMPPSVSYILRAKNTSVLGSSFTSIGSGSFTCSQVGGNLYESNNACQTAYDTLPAAKLLAGNASFVGETCAVGDIDYFAFSGKAGSFTANVISTSESIFDCGCAILDAQGVQLPLGGAEGYVRNDSYNLTEGCSCSLTTATAAKHYLKVYTSMPGGYSMTTALP